MSRLLARRPVTALAMCAAALALTAPAAAAPEPVTAPAAVLPYQDASLPVPDRVTDLLSRMTLDDKLGQMTQIEKDALVPQSDLAAYRIGSVLSGGDSTVSPNNAQTWADTYDSLQRTALATPLGIPVIYGIDAVHGHNAVRGATLFPHNIGLGATRDPALVQRIGRAVAEEVSGTGIDWDFAPCLCVARDDRWGRTYESYGETPELPLRPHDVRHGAAGRHPGRGSGARARHRQALPRRRRHRRRCRPGRHQAVRGRPARRPPAAVQGGGAPRRRLGDAVVQQLERRAVPCQHVPGDRRAEGRTRLHRVRGVRLGRGRPARRAEQASPARRSPRR